MASSELLMTVKTTMYREMSIYTDRNMQMSQPSLPPWVNLPNENHPKENIFSVLSI